MAKRARRNRTPRKFIRRQWPVIAAVALAVVVLGAGIVYALTRDEPGEKMVDQGNAHLPAEPTSYLWNSRPPTSGPHANQIARWGEHSEPVPEWLQVHNLEDGGVIMHYNCPEGCPEVVDELRAIVAEVGDHELILHPYENMDSRIAVTAWTRLLALDEVDRDQIVGFVKAYRGIDNHR